MVPDTTIGALVSGTLGALTWNCPSEVQREMLFAASFA
jgi:hypothetical protein